MRTIPWYLSIVFAGWFSVAQSFSGETNRSVFPEGFESQNGNSAGALFAPSAATQYQQLFRGTSLRSEWDSPVLINQIAFRVADGASSFNADIPYIYIYLPTSSRNPETMSSNFSENIGTDNMAVFAHTDVHLAPQGNLPVNPFDVTFKFDQPFYFDPTQGSLLLYIVNPGALGTRSLDAHEYSSFDSSPFAATIPGSHRGDPNITEAFGLVTQFTWTAIPEPRQLSLFFSGAVGLAVAHRAKRKERRVNS